MKKIYMLIASVLMLSSSNAQLLQEDFNTGIPGTWTVVDNLSDGLTWNANMNYQLDGTNSALVDSDSDGNGIHMIEELVSPAFDATGFASVILEFDQYYRNIGADYANVDVWDGAAWQNVLTQSATVGAVGVPDHQVIDITAFANPAMQVRFYYDDANDWAWYWSVDNVVVNGSNCNSVSGPSVANVTSSSADISWTSIAANFDLQWGTPAFVPGTGNELGALNTSNNPETINGLMQGTNYDAWVRSNCAGTSIMISGAFDGPLTGGTPKGIELYVMDDIADLSVYGIGSANNGGGSDGEEFTFPAVSVSAGQYIYITTDSAQFNNFFGFDADYISGSMLINGDDAVELFYQGNAVDVFGDINVDGTGQSWEYLDGWAYRINGMQPTTLFADTDWNYSGINALDGETTNGTAATPFPNGTFTTVHAVSAWVGPVSFMTMFSEDASVTAFTAPNTGCGLGATDTVSILIENFGVDTIFSFDVCYVMNAGTPACETVTDTILPGGVYAHTFTATVDLTTPGQYDFDAYVTVAADINNGNDTLNGYSIQSVQTISSLPYSEDFEAGPGGWAGNGDWQHGVPAGPTINTVASCGSGTMAWMTNLTGTYSPNANFTVESPCIDFSSLTSDPVIVFDHNRELETSFDRAWLESSIDGGATWTKVGSGLTGVNWYNNTASEYWEGTSGAWLNSAHVLNGLAGQSAVRLRFIITSDGSVQQDGFAFDNINIQAAGALVSAAPNAIISPLDDCGLTANEFVIGEFTNQGSDTLFSFDVCYILNGGTPVCETVTDTILPGGTYQHTFATTGDFSTVGANSIDLVITAATDLSSCDDTLALTVNNKQLISNYPYLETFENGQGGWTEDNTVNGSWEFGTPAQANINTAYSGNNAWVAGGLTGGYNANENSSVNSPCFDFTNLQPSSWVAMKVYWDCENSWDGANLQISDDGGSTWQNVGAFGSPNNWFNDNTINSSPGGSQEGWTGNGTEWVIAKHELDDTLIGKTDVAFRINFGSDGSVQQNGFAFDDFAIGTAPTINIGPDYVGCGSYEIDPGQTGMYEWFTQDTSALPTTYPHSNGSSAIFQNTGTSDTTYNAIVIFTDSLGLCASDTAMLTLNPAPFVDLADVSNCPGDTAWFSVDTSSVYTYSWSTGSTTDSAMVTVPGPVTVTVTHTGTSCATSDSVNVYQVTSVDLAATLSGCQGDSVLIDAGANYAMYNWDNGSTNQMIYVSITDTVMVTVTDSIGCISMDSSIVTINALPTPTISGGLDTICVNHDLTLDAGAGFSAYAWSTSGTAQMETVSGTVLGVGTHVISVTVTDGNSCSNSDSITVVVDACTDITSIENLGLTIYPNPSTGIFRYDLSDFEGDVNMTITDASGRLIETLNLTSVESGEIDLSNEARGVYVLSVRFDGGMKTIQLIKQ